MTETTTTPEAETPEADPPQAEPQEDGGSSSAERASREAARYRVRLREAEAQVEQRDAVLGAMRTEIDRLHTAEVERMAASSAHALTNPADLWLVTSLDDLRAEDGSLDDAKVRAVLRDVLRERPQWRKSSPGMDGGVRSGGVPQGREASFGDLLKRRGS